MTALLAASTAPDLAPGHGGLALRVLENHPTCSSLSTLLSCCTVSILLGGLLAVSSLLGGLLAVSSLQGCRLFSCITIIGLDQSGHLVQLLGDQVDAGVPLFAALGSKMSKL